MVVVANSVLAGLLALTVQIQVASVPVNDGARKNMYLAYASLSMELLEKDELGPLNLIAMQALAGEDMKTWGASKLTLSKSAPFPWLVLARLSCLMAAISTITCESVLNTGMLVGILSLIC